MQQFKATPHVTSGASDARSSDMFGEVRQSEDSEPGIPHTSNRECAGISSMECNLSFSQECSFIESERLRIEKSRRVRSVRPAIRTSRTIDSSCSTKRCVESQYFDCLMCLLIVSNVFFFGFEVQSLIGVAEEDIPLIYRIVEYAYTGCFAVELALRIHAYGCVAFACRAGRAWNLLDLGLVLTSWLEVFLELLQGSNTKFAYARIIRVARTARIVRIVRIMKFFRPLRILIFSITTTLRSLFWTIILMIIIIYLFALVFTLASTQALADNTSSNPRLLEQHWGTLWLSLATLFKNITGGMDWENSMEALYTVHEMWGVLFMAYIAFSHLALLNVVTGVVCQTAIESAQRDQDIVMHSQLAEKQKYVEQLQGLFTQVDCDRSGSLTLEEFEDRLQDSSLQAYFAAMDLTTDEAWTLFKLLDTSETFTIDLDEFVSGCLKLRGAARSIDVHMLMYENKWTMNKLTGLAKSFEEMRDHLFHPTRMHPGSLGTTQGQMQVVERRVNPNANDFVEL